MNRMNRRSFMKAAGSVPVSLACRSALFGLESADGPEEAQTARTRGHADPRFELTLRRVLEGDAPRYGETFLLADVRPTAERRFTKYSGDLSGRYIGALASAARVYGVEAPGLDALVEKVIALQKPEGYFGSSFHFDKPLDDADMALLWGNGRLLVGLLEYYRWKPSDTVLGACRRLGDFLVRVSPLMQSKEIRDAFGAQHFASSYICWTQQTEGLTNLFAVTRDERYRKLAEEIARVIERRPGDHVHGYLTSLRGVMDLYALWRDKPLLEQCETAWREIVTSPDLLITGGVPEGWSPNNHRTEGCAEADWVRLNLALWRATENTQYLAMAEKAIFNEFAFNQFATGDFGHRVYSETGLPGAGAVRAWWCCTLHGLRCFPEIQESAFRASEGKLSFDLPVSGHIEGPALAAVSESTLARDGRLRITITRAPREPVFLEIRRPEWASGIDVGINGVPRREWLDHSFSKVWIPGDVIEVTYQMGLRSEHSGTDREVFRYGPWLLGASAADNPAYFNELTTQNRLIAQAEAAAHSDTQKAKAFSIPVAASETRYAQAEYPDQPGRLMLKPIAEQTGQPTTSWELRFLSSGMG